MEEQGKEAPSVVGKKSLSARRRLSPLRKSGCGCIFYFFPCHMWRGKSRMKDGRSDRNAMEVKG